MEGTHTASPDPNPLRLFAELLGQAIARYNEAMETERLYAEIRPSSATPDPDALDRLALQASRAFELAERNLTSQLRAYRKAALGTREDVWPFAVEVGGLVYVVPGKPRNVQPGYRVVVVEPGQLVAHRAETPAA